MTVEEDLAKMMQAEHPRMFAEQFYYALIKGAIAGQINIDYSKFKTCGDALRELIEQEKLANLWMKQEQQPPK